MIGWQGEHWGSTISPGLMPLGHEGMSTQGISIWPWRLMPLRRAFLPDRGIVLNTACLFFLEESEQSRSWNNWLSSDSFEMSLAGGRLGNEDWRRDFKFALTLLGVDCKWEWIVCDNWVMGINWFDKGWCNTLIPFISKTMLKIILKISIYRILDATETHWTICNGLG